jgi:hypothetical protein
MHSPASLAMPERLAVVGGNAFYDCPQLAR